MAIEKLFLHGTRVLSDEPILDQAIGDIPPAFSVPTTKQVLELQVTGYNRLDYGRDIQFALGGLAMRILNSFFAADPERTGTVKTAEILEIWDEYGIIVCPNQTGLVQRGVNALNAIRMRIDNYPFVDRDGTGSGHQSYFSIRPDVIFTDKRRPLD